MIVRKEKYVYLLSIIIRLFILFLELFILSVMCTFYSYIELVITKIYSDSTLFRYHYNHAFKSYIMKDNQLYI